VRRWGARYGDFEALGKKGGKIKVTFFIVIIIGENAIFTRVNVFLYYLSAEE
jgi:hypothetical protein